MSRTAPLWRQRMTNCGGEVQQSEVETLAVSGRLRAGSIREG